MFLLLLLQMLPWTLLSPHNPMTHIQTHTHRFSLYLSLFHSQRTARASCVTQNSSCEPRTSFVKRRRRRRVLRLPERVRRRGDADRIDGLSVSLRGNTFGPKRHWHRRARAYTRTRTQRTDSHDVRTQTETSAAHDRWTTARNERARSLVRNSRVASEREREHWTRRTSFARNSNRWWRTNVNRERQRSEVTTSSAEHTNTWKRRLDLDLASCELGLSWWCFCCCFGQCFAWMMWTG